MAAMSEDVAKCILADNYSAMFAEWNMMNAVAVATILKFQEKNGPVMDDDPEVEEAYEKFADEVDFMHDWASSLDSDSIHERLCAKWVDDCENKKNSLVEKRKEMTRMFFKQKDLYEQMKKSRNWGMGKEIADIKREWLTMYREFLKELEVYDDKNDIVTEDRLSQLMKTADYFHNDLYRTKFTT